MVERDAEIVGEYRYWLSRKYDGDECLANSNRKCLFIGINPNTANGKEDDNTATICMHFAKNFGCGVLYIVNLYAIIGKNPKERIEKPNSIGKDNDKYILKYAKMCSDNDSLIVVAWGNLGRYNGRGKYVKKLLCDKGYKLHCIKINEKTGEPHHPTRIKITHKPIPYPC
jgi:hypothetical protein